MGKSGLKQKKEKARHFISHSLLIKMMKPESVTLQNQYLPDYHFNEVHRITIEASRENIFEKISAFDFSGSMLIGLLFKLRGLPVNTSKGLDGVLKMGFSLLEMNQPQELILGLIGQFWK